MAAHAKQLTNRASEEQPASIVRIFIDALGRLGYDTRALLAKGEVEPSDLANPDARIPCAALGAILAAAVEQRPMKNLAMRLAAETLIGAFPLVDYLVLTSDSVGAGLKQLARYYRLVDAPYLLEFREDEEPVRVLYESSANAFSMEFGIVLCLLHLGEETDGGLSVAYTSFSHRLDDIAEMERVLGCPIHSEAAWNGFALSRHAWQLPLRRRDPILRSVLERQAEEIGAHLHTIDPVTLDIRRVLAQRLAKGDTQIQDVARALLTSPRSLQRRLAAAGASYQRILDAVRQEAADRYLSGSTLAIGEVAYLLGDSEPATFHRAFKRWKGITPQEFRRVRGSTRVSPLTEPRP